MLHYQVFSPANDGTLHYGSPRSGVESSSKSLGLGPKEMQMIAETHGLFPKCVLKVGLYWALITSVSEEYETEWLYLPPYEDPDYEWGGEVWSLALQQRLTREARMMEDRDG